MKNPTLCGVLCFILTLLALLALFPLCSSLFQFSPLGKNRPLSGAFLRLWLAFIDFFVIL
jgi:hypothetical protein